MSPTLSDPAELPVPADRISVVIVNFNAGDYLRRAVASVRAEAGLAAEIVVVDNASRDQSLATLPQDPGLRVLRQAENLGFAAACNIGIQATRHELVLLLNPDCQLFPGALAALVAALDVHAYAGMAGPLLLNPDGSEQRGGRRDIPTPWQIFCFLTRVYRLMPNHPRFRNFNRANEPVPPAAIGVQAISGACMLVRRSAIETIGLMDSKRFFLHFEDLDWCLRFGNAGLGVLFVPDARVEHTQGVCSRSRPIRVEYQKHRSMIQFLRKHFVRIYPAFFMTTVSLLVTLRFCLLVLRLLFRHRSPSL